MTTYRAVAAATTAFAQRVKQSITPLDGAIVTTERPNTPVVGGPPRVNIFLYHVEANPYLTTDDLPTRRPDGSLMQKPKIALDLYYLLSFYGDEKPSALEPQVLLGLTMSGVHARPILAPEEYGALADAILPGDYVALTPLPLNIHELSRLWQMFVQVPYVLSMSLKASAAILIADLPVETAPPVRQTGLEVVQISIPIVKAAGAPPDGRGPLVYGQMLLIQGSGLGGAGTLVSIGEATIIPPASSIAETHILLSLNDAALRAGVQSLVVVTPGDYRSTPLEVVIAPAVLSLSATATTLTLTIGPWVSAGQAVDILLRRIDPVGPGQPTDYTLRVQAEASTDTLTAPTSHVLPGRYAVRIRVAGLESQTRFDVKTGHDEPMVMIGART